VNRVDIFWIGKKDRDEFDSISQHLIKNSLKFGRVSETNIWNKEIQKTQASENVSEIEKSYENSLKKYFSKDSFNIILDPLGKKLDTNSFANILHENPRINFFIGGAWGFNESFRKSGDLLLQLSPLTFSHKIAKIVLLEQIYRGLSINGGHSYHK
jgi:23S rRNA (pseudouridine1915-N3)-methyltransferase